MRKCIFRTIVATAIAACLTYILKSDLNADLVTSTLCGTSDVEVSDFYNRIRAGGSVKPIDDNIVLVTIDSVYDRSELAALIEDIARQQPAAIGVDIVFSGEKDEFGDAMLIDAVTVTPNIVMAQQYNDCDYAPAPDLISLNTAGTVRGMANLTSTAESDMVRLYTPFFGEGRQYPAFATALLSVIDSSAYNRLCSRDGTDELIRFQPEEFYVATPAEVKSDSTILSDKIVLIGTVNDPADLHPTPLSNRFPGLMIQANALSMMLSNDYVRPVSSTINIILSVLSCIILAYLYIYLDSAQNLILRILPVIWILAIGYIGCVLFNSYGVYIDAPGTMLLSALALLVLDVWCAFEPLVKRLYHKLKIHHKL